ncbi:MAG: rhodanese-like domain-containing protein [Thiogranum sp.]|nr:rhodanese-like domain-containing protein [Thiogranum sp.]
MIRSAQESFFLIDVRSVEEMAQGVLPNAEPVPMHLIPLKIHELRERKTLIFYCRSGARSAQVYRYLLQQGVDRVTSLRGGIAAWCRDGLHLEVPVFSSPAEWAANFSRD